MEKDLIKLLAGNKENLSSQSINNGALFVTLDSAELFFDLDNKRIKISDITILDSNTLPDDMVENKIYLKSDGSFWRKINNEVKQIGGSLTQEQIDIFNSKTNITISNIQPTHQQKGDVWFIIED